MGERDDLWQAIYEASPYNAPVPCKHFAHRQQGGWDACAECEADGIYAAVIKHLTESGRLLPPGGEVKEQWSVLAADKDGRPLGGPICHSLKVARKWKVRLEADRSVTRVSLAIYRRQMTVWEDGSEQYTPWSPVVSDNSEEKSSG